MQNYKTSLVITLALGFISMLSLIFMVLAFLDIYQGREPDLSNEWAVVVLGLFVFLILISSAIFTTLRLLIRKTF